MAGQEFELITGETIRHVKVFFNDITYRNYHYHAAFELFLVMEGSGCINLPGQTIPLEKGTLILLNPDEAHEIDAFGGHVILLLIQISRHFCREYLTDFGSLRFRRHVLTEKDGIVSKMLEIAQLHVSQMPHIQYLLLGRTAELLHVLLEMVPHEQITSHDSSAMKKRTLRMNRMLDYLEQNFSNPVRLQNLAEMESLTTTHLSHIFTEQLGVSFQTYLNNLRFEHAAAMLSAQHLPVSEAAYLCGFSDPKYLNRMMQKRMGCTAAEFRDGALQLQYSSRTQSETTLERYLTREEARSTMNKRAGTVI